MLVLFDNHSIRSKIFFKFIEEFLHHLYETIILYPLPDFFPFFIITEINDIF